MTVTQTPDKLASSLTSCSRLSASTLPVVPSHSHQKDQAWFVNYLPTDQGVFIIHPEDRTPVCLYVDACETGCGAVFDSHAYHDLLTSSVLQASPLICHLEALNAAVALKLWNPILSHRRVHLFCDNAAAVCIFQVGESHDPFLQRYARDIWLTYATWDIALAISHIPGERLRHTADALSRYHLGAVYRKRVHHLEVDSHFKFHNVLDSLFFLPTNI